MTDLTHIFEQAGMRILDALGEAVFGFDANGRCLHAGRPALNLLQVSAEAQLIGRPIDEVLNLQGLGSLPPWDQCLAYMRANVGKGMRSELEELLRSDGVEIPVTIALISLPMTDGSFVLAVVVRDIGDLTRQSKAFHASVKSFRSLLDSVSDAIFFVSRQGKVVDANLGINIMFGITPVLFQGKSIDNILDPEHHSRGLISDVVPEVLAGQSRRIEFTARNHKGEIFPAEIYLYPSSYFNQAVAMAIVHDISERQRQEALLREARDQAEQSSRLKSEIIRNMSHEFRTPLTAIIGMGDMLADTELDEEQAIFLEEARSSARNLLEMVNSILDLAKLESGHYRPEGVDFNVEQLLSLQVRRFSGICGKKGIGLRIQVDPALPVVVHCDMEALNKTLALLIDNAIKFTDHGEVLVSAQRVENVEGFSGGAVVRFSVKDTGVGISETARSRLFDAFVQGDGSATRRHGGIGLGLGIASRLVAIMDGSLAVDSELDVGSEFHFTLKLQPPEFQP